MNLPADLLRRAPREAAGLIALARLDAASRAAPRLADASDKEALHDFRVAIRRLRTALGIWRRPLRKRVKKRHRRALRALQRSTGRGRDLEVAVAWAADEVPTLAPEEAPGGNRVLEAFTADPEAGSARADAQRAFAEIEPGLRRRLEKAARPPERRAAGRAFGSRVAEAVIVHGLALVGHLRAIESASDRVEAHAARIRCKRLRYLLEPFRDHVRGARRAVRLVRELQDVLGDLNDAHVRLDLLAEVQPDEAERPGVEAMVARTKERRGELFRQLSSTWLVDGADRLMDCLLAVSARAALRG